MEDGPKIYASKSKQVNNSERNCSSASLNDEEVCVDESSKHVDKTSGEDSFISLPANLPPSPDGGWGWIIVIVSFLINLIVDGIGYSFSSFMTTYSSHFKMPTANVAWIASIQTGLCLCSGPVVSSLINRFGCRPVCLSGAVVASLGYLSTTFCSSIELLMLTQGCLVGLGLGMTYLPGIICVSYYFEKKRALAIGISVCGSGLGIAVAPPIVNELIKQLGWKRANMVIASMFLTICIFALLMRPLKVPKMLREEFLHRIAEEQKMLQSNSWIYNPSQSSFQRIYSLPGSKNHSKKTLNYDPGMSSNLSFSEYSVNSSPNSTQDSQIFHGSESNYEKDFSERYTSPVLREAPSGGFVWHSRSLRSRKKNEWHHTSTSFEKKPSGLQLMGHVNIIPATDQLSYTNVRQVNSMGLIGSRSGVVGDEDKHQHSKAIDGETVERKRHNSEKQSVTLPPLCRKDIFYSGSLYGLEEFKRQGSLLSYRQSTFYLPNACSGTVLNTLSEAFDDPHHGEEPPKEIEGGDAKYFGGNACGPLRNLLSFQMLLNRRFLLMAAADFVGILGFSAPFIYLPSAAIEKGVSKDNAALIVSLIGIANTVSRVVSGIISDHPHVNCLLVTSGGLLLSALCLLLMPLLSSFGTFMGTAFAFGLFIAPFTTLTSIVIVNQFGLQNLTNAYGLLMLFRGLGSVIGPPLAGGIYDSTKTYNATFWAAGAFIACCSVLYGIIAFLNWFYPGPEKDVPVRYQTNEECLQAIPEEEIDVFGSQEGEGIVFDVKSKSREELVED